MARDTQVTWDLKPNWWQVAPLYMKEDISKFMGIPIGALPFVKPTKIVERFTGCGCILWAGPKATCLCCRGFHVLKEAGMLTQYITDVIP